MFFFFSFSACVVHFPCADVVVDVFFGQCVCFFPCADVALDGMGIVPRLALDSYIPCVVAVET